MVFLAPLTTIKVATIAITFDNGPNVSLATFSMVNEGPRNESRRSNFASLFLVSILEFCLMKERDGTGILCGAETTAEGSNK